MAVRTSTTPRNRKANLVAWDAVGHRSIRRAAVGLATMLALVVTSVPLHVLAQSGRPGLAVMPLGRRGGVGNLAAKRIEEYLRAMIEAGNTVRLIPSSTVDAGKASRSRKRKISKEESRALKRLEKADQAAITGREMLASGSNMTSAIKLLTGAIRLYEANFVELADFTKLVDAYQRAAMAALGTGQKKRALLYVLKALTLQPTFVVDARKANKNLQTLVTRARARLAKKSFGVIKVEATKPGSSVFIDGVKLGTAPLEAKDLPVGQHFIQVKKEGAKPWGKAVQIRNRKPIKVHAAVIMEYDPANDIELMVKPSDVKPFADKGNFHQRVFRNYGFMFARQIDARYLLYGAVSKSSRGIELHLFLYDAQIKRAATLKPIYFAGNLSDMQMKILEAEGHIRAAVHSFPTDREVTELPEIYTRTTKSRTVTAPPPATAPTTTTPARTAEPTPSATPRPTPTPSPVVRPTPTPTQPRKAGADPYAGLLKQRGDDEPSGGVTSKWWFWTGVGAVVVAGGVTAYLLLSQEPKPNPNFTVSAQLPGN